VPFSSALQNCELKHLPQRPVVFYQSEIIVIIHVDILSSFLLTHGLVWYVCVSVCVLATTASRAITAEPIEVPFGGRFAFAEIQITLQVGVPWEGVVLTHCPLKSIGSFGCAWGPTQMCPNTKACASAAMRPDATITVATCWWFDITIIIGAVGIRRVAWGDLYYHKSTMSTSEYYYEILGVDKTATTEDIKKA